jgi:hypothetical protein
VQFLIVLAILVVVVLFVVVPLRRGRSPATSSAREAAAAERTALADLEAAREAKYREIRDAELDHRTGKLSDADYEAVDTALRAEAIEILRSLDRAQGMSGEAQSGSDLPGAGRPGPSLPGEARQRPEPR